MKALENILALVFAVLLAVSCIKDGPQKEFELEKGDSIPNFTVQMNDGSTVSSVQLRSGIAIIMFFHTSCPDCQNTLPAVQQIYNEWGNEISVVLISREQEGAEIARYWKEKGYNLPYSPQSTREIYNLFATSRVPRVYICNNGIIEHIFTDSPIPTYSDLAGILGDYLD